MSCGVGGMGSALDVGPVAVCEGKKTVTEENQRELNQSARAIDHAM